MFHFKSMPSSSLIFSKAILYSKKSTHGGLEEKLGKVVSVTFLEITMAEHFPTCSRRRNSYPCSFHLSLLVKLNIHHDPRLNPSHIPLAIQLVILMISRINIGHTWIILSHGHAQSTNFGDSWEKFHHWAWLVFFQRSHASRSPLESPKFVMLGTTCSYWEETTHHSLFANFMRMVVDVFVYHNRIPYLHCGTILAAYLTMLYTWWWNWKLHHHW